MKSQQSHLRTCENTQIVTVGDNATIFIVHSFIYFVRREERGGKGREKQKGRRRGRAPFSFLPPGATDYATDWTVWSNKRYVARQAG